MDNHPENKNVYAEQCDDETDRQKWYLDAIGRIRSRKDSFLCLGLNKTSNNLLMETCNDSLSQRFSFPNSFPIVSTDTRTAFAKRQELNSIYGEVDQQVYGEETRSILRYQHPDQVQRNLCPYWERNYAFTYTMQNYQVSTGSVIELKYTDEMTPLLYGGSSFDLNSTASFMVSKPLNVLRPKQKEGYFRLGDYVSNDPDDVYSAVLVSAELGSVLKKPDDYELVWNVTVASITGAFWKPIPPPGYSCLGHVWGEGTDKPATKLIRCIQDRFLETAPSTLIWDNSGSNEGDASLWTAGSTANSMTSGTFVSKASMGPPAKSEFKALKKKCVLGLGNFPFCGAGDSMNLAVNSVREFSLPYAKLKPCYYRDEDQQLYGLVNEENSEWESHTFELHKYAENSVGYKHVGASKQLREPYCLGSVVFGSNTIKNDLLIHNLTGVGSVTKKQVDDQRNGKSGNSLAGQIGGDFVFLFPCADTNEVKEYKKTLQQLAADASIGGLSENGVVNDGEDLGEIIKFGDAKWSTPHYCGLSEEPTESGGCKLVDFCFFEPGGCKPYDQLACTDDDDCKGGFCAEDGLCGKVRHPML